MPTKPFDQCRWRMTWLWRHRGEAHGQQAVPALDRKRSATGFKCNHLFRVAENLKDDMGGRQRRVATEINFRNRRKPAEMEAFWGRYEEGCLREIIFFGNGLEICIIQPSIERAYGCWVTLKNSTGESIDLVLLDSHDWLNLCAWGT